MAVIGLDSPRQRLGGWLLTAMLVSALAGAWGWLPAWVAGVCGWAAGACLWPRASRTQRLQCAWLVGLGLLAAALARGRGASLDPVALLTQNLPLLAMLCAVTFLRLVAAPQGAAPGARGPVGYWRSLLGLHLFGAVINLSALVIVGDRLQRGGVLGREAARLLSRGFSSAAYWSPFFAAMATALTYAPGARIGQLMACGLPLALLALAFTHWQGRARPGGLDAFLGYPLRLESLWLPSLLAAAVLLGHWLLPQWRVLTLITLLAPLLTVCVVLARWGPLTGGRQVRDHLVLGLPTMHGELLLFLSAGVLGAGLAGLAEASRAILPAFAVDAATLVSILAATVLLSLLGVHPVVSIAAVAALLGPVSEPTPLAAAYLAGWAIGAAASPLSGMHLLMQGRYGFSGRQLLQWNLTYTLMMTLASAAMVVAVSAWPETGL